MDQILTYISDVLREPIYYPAMALCASMDYLFKDEQWWTYEYETILKELADKKMPKPSTALLGEIQCISALRNGKALIDKEWHLFEKACAALTGIPVLFYEKQNLPIENVLHAINLMKKFGPFEMSDEVQHYVGCEAINDELFWYPIEYVDKYLYDALQRLKVPMGFDMTEIDQVRKTVSERFEAYQDMDIEKAVFKESSEEDQMCLRIFRSLAAGRSLMEKENECLNTFNNIKDGVMAYTGKKTVETTADIPEDEENSYDIPPNIDIVDLDSGDIETFEDGVKEAALDLVSQYKDIVDGFASGTIPFEAFPSVKLAAIPDAQVQLLKYARQNGLHVITGVNIGHIFPDDPSDFKQEETDPIDNGQPADQILSEYVSENLENGNSDSDDDVTDPFI